MKSLNRVQLLATLWTAAYQAPPSMGFSRQEYWNGVPLPSLKGMLENSKTYTPIWFLKNKSKGRYLIPAISKLCYQMKYFIQIPSWPSDLSEDSLFIFISKILHPSGLYLWFIFFFKFQWQSEGKVNNSNLMELRRGMWQQLQPRKLSSFSQEAESSWPKGAACS